MVNNELQPLPTGASWGAYCSCGCGTLVSTDTGNVLPAADLVDNFVFEFDGELDYIELFVRAHVIGRTFRNGDGKLFVVRADGDSVCAFASEERAIRETE